MTVMEALVADGLVRESVALGTLTTYKAGGPARYFFEARDRAAIEEFVATGALRDLPLLVLGRGSNLVVADEGFPGVVIRLGEGFSEIAFEGESVRAGAAVMLPRLARACVDSGRVGLEFFVGIPGSVGGAVRQNAGCFGAETADRLISAVVFDVSSGQITARTPQELDMSYRHSNLSQDHVVLEAAFKLDRGDTDVARSELRRITRWRRDNQPGGTLNAGSVFKNPPGEPAGALIDRLGLKGMSVGDVKVSEKHANFFIAGPDATAADIRALVRAVKSRVFDETGTILEPEIQFVGFTDGD